MNKLKKLNILLFILNIMVFICICFLIPENTKVSKNDLQKKKTNAEVTYNDYTEVVNIIFSGRYSGNSSFTCTAEALVHVYDYNRDDYDYACIDRISQVNNIQINVNGDETFSLDSINNPSNINISGISSSNSIILEKLDDGYRDANALVEMCHHFEINFGENLVIVGNFENSGELYFNGENLTIDENTRIRGASLLKFLSGNTIIKNIGTLNVSAIDIPNGTIKRNANEYANINYLKIGQDVIIEPGALYNVNIVNIELANNKYYLLDGDGIIFTKDKTRLIYCTDEFDSTSYKVPRTVTSIDDRAFFLANKLNSIIIPKTVTNMAEREIFGSYRTNIICKSGTAAANYAIAKKYQYTLDDVAPIVSFENNGSSSPTKTASTKVTVSETGSEVYGNIYYTFLNKASGVTESEVKSAGTTLTSGNTVSKNGVTGDYYLYVYTEDYVGNTNITRSNVFKIDNTAPTVGVEYSNNATTRENIIVTLTSNEQLNTLSGWNLSTDKLRLTKTYENNTSEQGELITVSDLAGNTKTVTVKITNIDRVGPSLSVSYSKTTPTKDNVLATITSNEQLQGVTGWDLSLDKLSLTKTYSNNTSESGEIITAMDLVGNPSNITVKITNIDRVAPEVKMSISESEGQYKVTLTANEQVQSITGWEIDNNEKILTKKYTKEEIKQGETVKVLDLAGNEKTVNIKILPGDVNENGIIEIVDVLLLQRNMSAENNIKINQINPNWILDDERKIIGDVNLNGIIDINDIQMIKRHIAALNDNKIAIEHPDWLIN